MCLGQVRTGWVLTMVFQMGHHRRVERHKRLMFISSERNWGCQSKLERIESWQASGALAYTSGKMLCLDCPQLQKAEERSPLDNSWISVDFAVEPSGDGFSFKKFSIKVKYSLNSLFYRHLHWKNTWNSSHISGFKCYSPVILWGFEAFS